MRTNLSRLLAIALLAVPASAATVSVTGGMIRGQDLPDGSAIYRAVPFAAPPVGNLRWKAPAPVVPWKGVRNAVNAPHPCVQPSEGWNAAAAALGDEDCLYLSLHAPKHKKGAKLPVFVWIHGGSNRAGSGYGTADSAIYKHGIVIVGIEYRLGVFGFLSSPELMAESPNHASGNYALMDQIAALQWVKANIAKFGGDPDNVTVGGQSAGAYDVGMLLRSPLARGLFAKAVQHSGAPMRARAAKVDETLGSALLAKVQLPAGAEGLAALRALPALTVMQSAETLPSPDGAMGGLWGGAADGYVLQSGSSNLWTNGDQARVPLLIGDVTQEIPTKMPDSGKSLVGTVFGKDAPAILAAYGFKDDTPPPPDPVFGNVETQMLTDASFRCADTREALWHAEAGLPTWRYLFGVARPHLPAVAHNAELDYVFDAPPKDATFGTWPPVQRYWANFLKTGNPNGPGLPEWPAMGRAVAYIAFMPDGIKTGSNLSGEKCRVLETAILHIVDAAR